MSHASRGSLDKDKSAPFAGRTTEPLATNMGKPADFADILNGVMWFQVFLATVFIALRLYTRHWIVRNFGWDDVLMLVNLASQFFCILPPSTRIAF